MANPYIGEIRIFAGDFAPNGWFFCEGQMLPIAENEALFQLIGTTYGGDGQETFALPDMRGRAPVHFTGGASNPHDLGERGGVEEVTLTTQQIPVHAHPLMASGSAGTAASPAGSVLAAGGSGNAYRESVALAAMAGSSVGAAGGSQPHSNLQPYLCVNFIISLYGLFPSPT